MSSRRALVALTIVVAALLLFVGLPLADAMVRQSIGLQWTPRGPRWHGEGCRPATCRSPNGTFFAEVSSRPAVRPGERGHSGVWIRSKGDGIAWEASYDLPETWRSPMHLQWSADNTLWLHLGGDVDRLWRWVPDGGTERFPSLARRELGRPPSDAVLPHPLCRRAGTRCGD